MGLRKDAEGFSKLTDDDIKNIENGIPNYKFTNRYSIKNRLYIVIWQIDYYRKGHSPNGHSLTQRLEFLRCAWEIVKDNPCIGVGTGDLNDKMQEYYKKIDTSLEWKFRRTPHNQYVTFIVRHGILGYSIIIVAMFFVFYKEKIIKNYFFIVYLIIILLSMINEDTLETQAGEILISFFGSIFLFSYKPEEQEKPEK